MKKVLTALLSFVLAFALGAVALADGANPGSITILSSVSEKSYQIFNIFDMTLDGEGDDAAVSYTINPAWDGFFAGDGAAYIVGECPEGTELTPIIVDNVQKYINITESNVPVFADAALTYAAARNLSPVATGTGTGSDLTISDLPLGYYLVYPVGATELTSESSGSICSLTSTVPTAEVKIKAIAPEIIKTIVESGSEVTESTAAIGDSVSYKITGVVPDTTGFINYYYYVDDTLSKGLTFNDDVVITIGDAELTRGTDYTVTATKASETGPSETALQIVFLDFVKWGTRDDSGASLAGKPIIVTYSATVNQDAEVGINPNTNKAILNYSDNPFTNPEPGDTPGLPEPGKVIGRGTDHETKTFVADLTIIKVDGKDSTKFLSGALFSIAGTNANVTIINEEVFRLDEAGEYFMLKDGTFTKTAPVTTTDGYTADLYGSTTQMYSPVTEVTKDTVKTNLLTQGYTLSNGYLTFTGLGEGAFTLTELEAPAGYNKLTAPIEVTLGFSYDATTQKGTWTATGTGATVDDNGKITVIIENNAGTPLPETGDTGGLVFLIFGSLVMFLTGSALISKRVAGAKSAK